MEEVEQRHNNDLQRVEQRINQHVTRVESLMTKLEREIPVYVDERLYMSNATQLNLQPQSQNLELITCIISTISAPGGATLVLGNRTLILPQGNTVLNIGVGRFCGMLLNNGDLRQLTQATAGALSLELMGIEIPDKGAY